MFGGVTLFEPRNTIFIFVEFLLLFSGLSTHFFSRAFSSNEQRSVEETERGSLRFNFAEVKNKREGLHSFT